MRDLDTVPQPYQFTSRLWTSRPGLQSHQRWSVDDHTTRSLLRTRMTTFVTIWLSNSMQVTQSIQRTVSDNKFSSKKYTFGDPFSDGILCGSTFGWSPTEGWTVVLNKYILMFHLSSSFFFVWIIDLGSRGGAIVRALAFRQCGPGSNSGVDTVGVWVCCWFSPLLREVFLRVLRFFPYIKNQDF